MPVKLHCPKCEKDFSVRIMVAQTEYDKRIMRTGMAIGIIQPLDSITCPHCGHQE